MDECKRMGLKVLVPDINESFSNFTVNAGGQIRFGLAAIKGVGESAVEHILEVRSTSGSFKDIYDVVERVNLTIVNKRCIEALAMAGGFDSFSAFHRHQFFSQDEGGISFIEHLIRYGNRMQNQGNSTQTLFGDMASVQVIRPKPFPGEEWPALTKLNKEKELIGIYLSAHPLDNYKVELKHFCNATLAEFRNLPSLKGHDLTVAGIVTGVKHAMTKNGKPYGQLTLEDYSDTYTLSFFAKDYENFRKYIYEGYSLLIKGSVQENNWKNAPDLEFKVKNIYLLSNARDELIKSIQIRIPLDELSEQLLEKIKILIAGNKGSINLKVLLVDPAENISVDMFSRSKHIALSDDFIGFLLQNPGIEFRLF